MGNARADTNHALNPFANITERQTTEPQQPQPTSKPSDDLLSLFDPVPSAATASNTQPAPSMSLDPTNPFAQNIFQQPSPIISAPSVSAGRQFFIVPPFSFLRKATLAFCTYLLIYLFFCIFARNLLNVNKMIYVNFIQFASDYC